MFGSIGDKISDIFGALLNTMYTWLVRPFQELRTLKGLIFGRDSDTELAFGIFTLEELEGIYQPGMNIFVAISVTAILIGIIIAGMRISSAGINPSNRTYVYEFMKDLAIVAIVFFNLTTLYTLIFGANYAIVDVFASSYDNDLYELKESVEDQEDILGWILINLCLLGLSIWANFYYMMRRLTLIIFMIIGPLMIALYLIPQTKSITVAWLKEFIGTVFVQSIHAALYWIVALLAISTSGIESVILYLIFIPTAEAIRSLLGLGGDMASGLSKTGAMFGMGALGGMYGSIKGAMGEDGSVSGSLHGAYTGAKSKVSGNGGKGGGSNEETEEGKSTVASNIGTDQGSTAKAERMLKPGQITSKLGKAAFGMGGSIAGGTMGPGGAILGATGGFVLGGAAGGIAGRVGGATVQAGLGGLKHGAKSLKAGWGAGKDSLNADEEANTQIASSIADAQTTAWANKNKDQFMQEQKEKFPDATENNLQNMWNKKVEEKGSQNFNKAKSALGKIRKNDGKYANAKSLALATADSMTDKWADENKKQFMKEYDQKNPVTPQMSRQERSKHRQSRIKAWDNAVGSKRSQYKKIADNTANQFSNGLSLENAYINKDDFANKFADKAYLNDTKDNKPNSLPKGTYTQNARSAAQSVKSGKLHGVISKDVDRKYLASQLANAKTNEARKDFLEQHGGSSPQQMKIAEQQWQQRESAVHQQNLKDVSSTMPKLMSIPNRVLPDGLKTVGAIATGIGTSALAISGVNQVGQVLTNSKIGQMTTAGYSGLTQSLQNTRGENKGDVILTAVSRGGAAMKQVKQEVQTAWQSPTENPVEKQANFRNALAYTAGVVGGTRAYQKAGHMATKYNPYNKAVSQQTAEVADIANMAQRQIVDGQEHIAQGAVQLVTSNNESYIQVRDITGQTQVVSRKTTGDSSLQKGQIVYQDLTIQDGALIQESAPYRFDSGGGKVLTNREININPNKLVANRNTPNNPRVVQEVQAYNQLVDSRQLTSEDILTKTQNIRMVIERDRSYMIATDQSGMDYRISPYGKGDARLDTTEVRQFNCNVQNRRITKGPVVDQNNKRIDYYTSIDPNHLLPPKTNKRLEQRRRFEQKRHRNLGGTF